MWISKYVTSQALFALCRWETLSVICYHLLVSIVICYFIVYLPFAPLHVRQKTIMNQCLWFLVSKSCLVVTLQHSECDKMIHFVYLHMRKGKQRTKINPRINLATLYIHSLNSHWLSRSTCASLCHSTALPTLPTLQDNRSHLSLCSPAIKPSAHTCRPWQPHTLTATSFFAMQDCPVLSQPWLIFYCDQLCLPVYHLAFLNFLTIFIASWASCLVPPCWYLSYISNCIKSCSSADCFRTEPY